MDKRSIFKSGKSAWIVVGVYILALYSTLNVAFDAYVSLYARIGRESMSHWINLSFTALGLTVLLWILICIRPRLSGYLGTSITVVKGPRLGW